MQERTVAFGPLLLDDGHALWEVQQRVTIYGTPAPDCSNVVLIEHALTGSSRVAQWWPGIVGEGALFDPRDWCVVAVNALGSCYGSTGPRFDEAFPRVSVRDIVRAERYALAMLGFERFAFVIGGSLGGQRALQWALDEPSRIEHAIIVGAHDHHSAFGIALNALQRDAIALSPTAGLRLARKIAMLTYKSDDLLRRRHDRRRDRHGVARFDVEGYLEHQSDVFAERMHPASYVTLTHAMDSFDARNASLAGKDAPALTFVGISSDWLFRANDVRAAARRFALRGYSSRYLSLASDHGHDAFLAEPQSLRAVLEPVIHAPRALPRTARHA